MPNVQGEFTSEDLDAIRRVYPTLSTYRAEDESIKIADLMPLWVGIGWPRTVEQNDLYEQFFRQTGVVDERIPLPMILRLAATTTDKSTWIRAIINESDVNKDGFMSPEEYKVFFGIFGHHYPEWNVSYEDFVAGADVNLDGKVSVEEAINWILKLVEEKGQKA